jgi:hypothetical protein
MKKYRERLMQVVFLLSACISILAVFLICFFLFANGVPAIGKIGIANFLAGIRWKPSNNLFGKDRSIRKFLSRFCVDKGGLIYVGDELRDIEACRLAGVRIVAVTWGFDPAPLIESGKPDFIATTPGDVLHTIQSLRAGQPQRT